MPKQVLVDAPVARKQEPLIDGGRDEWAGLEGEVLEVVVPVEINVAQGPCRQLNEEVGEEVQHLLRQVRVVVEDDARALRAHPTAQHAVEAKAPDAGQRERVVAPLLAAHAVFPPARVADRRLRVVTLLHGQEAVPVGDGEAHVLVHGHPRAPDGTLLQRAMHDAVPASEDDDSLVLLKHLVLEARDHVRVEGQVLPPLKAEELVPVHVEGSVHVAGHALGEPALDSLPPHRDLHEGSVIDILKPVAGEEPLSRGHGPPPLCSVRALTDDDQYHR